jgi:lipopolysaccharide export system permease protein
MLPALMLFLGYLLLLSSMRSAIEKNAIPSIVGLWPIHISALFIGIMFLMKERSSGRMIKAKLPQIKRRTNKKNTQVEND